MANEAQTALKLTPLTARLIEGFAVTYLYKGFDEVKPTPQFHRDGWDLYASDQLWAAVIAPRGHAKSSALTHVFLLASVLFRHESYVVLVSTNEELAIEHLGDIARELTENEDLITDFEVKGFVVSSKTDIIVEFKDGHQFRIIARGSGQKMRGRKWRGMRPGLIVCDDLEDDETVENKDRRDKFRRWFNRAVLPAVRRGGKVRVHGTVLHEDSLLSRFLKDHQKKGDASSWKVVFCKAHKAFDDFSEILWPEQFSEADLRKIRQTYIDDFDASGYSQEYLNSPYDHNDAYFKQAWFTPMEGEDFNSDKRVFVGADFAISKADRANRTSFTVGGVSSDNYLHILDQSVDRWATDELIDEMFRVQAFHEPEAWFVEDGVIWKAIEPILLREMRTRNVYLNCIAMLSVKDKATRARSLQKRMKARAVRFDKEAQWYAGYEAEMLKFTGYSEAVADDQVDSTSILSRGVDELPLLDETDFMTEEELYYASDEPRRDQGRSTVTGY